MNYDVEGFDFTISEVSELLISEEKGFVNGSYEMSLSESSKISKYKF